MIKCAKNNAFWYLSNNLSYRDNKRGKFKKCVEWNFQPHKRTKGLEFGSNPADKKDTKISVKIFDECHWMSREKC